MKKILVFLLGFFTSTSTTFAQESIFDIDLNDINGIPIDLKSFEGKYIMFVNVASYCGFTPQYKALENLYQKYNDDLIIIGVPCNQFGAQEPGNSKEIQQFCKKNYGVSFYLSEKLNVKGVDKHPLYKWLTDKNLNGVSNSSVKWNFQKYLVDRKGSLITYFYSTTDPMSTKITSILTQ
tara:strand:- start:10400 stop:10936 length:537 start_codon:yes stop_codon:yes gene_type:complete